MTDEDTDKRWRVAHEKWAPLLSDLGYLLSDIVEGASDNTWIAQADYDSSNTLIKEGAALWVHGFGKTEEEACENLYNRIKERYKDLE